METNRKISRKMNFVDNNIENEFFNEENIKIDKFTNMNIPNFTINDCEAAELFKNVREILGSTIRIKVLISLFLSKKNPKQIQDETNLPQTAILSGLKDLKKINVVKKVEKEFFLSSNGHMIVISMLRFFENLYAIKNSFDFLENHYLRDIPLKQLNNILMIKNAKCIASSKENLTKPSTEYLNLISKSKNLKILMPIFSTIYLDGILNSLSNENSLELVITDNILKYMKLNDYGDKLSAILNEISANDVNAKHNKKENSKIRIDIVENKSNLNENTQNFNNNQLIKIWKIPDDFKLFLSSCDNFLALHLFFKDDYYDDSEMLIDETKNGIKWGAEIFEHYRKKGELIDIEEYFYSN